jgi:DnaK suppressor protein
MPQLSPEFLQEMKQKLTDEKIRIEKELPHIGTKNTTSSTSFTTTFPEYGDDEEENANEIADYAANLSIEKDLEKLLRDLTTALKRIEDGTYGICKYCQKPIDQKRLLARPTSSSCVDCKKTITQEV